MDSIVLELQKEALNSAIEITDLLRKALIVARKLGITEFQKWIELELKGYTEKSQVPEYRFVIGQVRIFNHFYGSWTQLMIDDVELAEQLSKRTIYQPVGEIGNILKADVTTSSFEIPYPPKLEISLRKVYGLPAKTSFFVDRGRCFRILEAVRNIILEWTLKLEGNNILGEGMSFSKKEKEAASNITFNIKNFIAQMSHSQIQQDTVYSSQSLSNNQFDIEKLKIILLSLKETISDLSISEQSKSELNADVDTIQAQLISPKPKTSIIRECLHSIRTILESAAGNVTAAQLISLIGQLFS